MPRPVLTGHFQSAVHDTAASRAIETQALGRHAAHELMRRAGTALARLALAVAPHARRVWVAAGPGNNGGDGLIAAGLLHRAGLQVQVSLLGDGRALPGDAAWALGEARQSGVPITATAVPPPSTDLAIDALLGLGARREASGDMARAIDNINSLQTATRIAVDLPSGLNADTGQPIGGVAVRATHTLALLTLKPGLLTGSGRDHAGNIWLDTLGCDDAEALPAAQTRLASAADLAAAWPMRQHASHKGSFGDVAVVGGAPGMSGAALLASRAALAAGAGRVFVVLLDDAAPALDTLRPEVMFRQRRWLSDPATLARSTVVCGCGGGTLVQAVLPALLSRCPRLVLDADALNALAVDGALRSLLDARAGRGHATVLTPHPLEAARLLGVAASEVQADRLRWARELANRHGCVVVLKGSGSLVAAPGGQVVINPTGNALLAGGGSGDVLAGWLGGLWAQLQAPRAAFSAAVASTWLHGRSADLALWAHPACRSLRAADLPDAMRSAAQRAAPS
jgi:hydroxyethylthiazole kinase-like uncharacterized protein yjeF